MDRHRGARRNITEQFVASFDSCEMCCCVGHNLFSLTYLIVGSLIMMNKLCYLQLFLAGDKMPSIKYIRDSSEMLIRHKGT